MFNLREIRGRHFRKLMSVSKQQLSPVNIVLQKQC